MSDEVESITDKLKSRILKYFPNLNLENSILIDSGWDNYVLIINQELVFRFPKNNRQRLNLLTEFNLLRFLTDFPFRVPIYTYIANEKDVFGGYRIIEGIPLNSANRISNSLIGDFITLFSYMWKIDQIKCSQTGISFYSPETWLNHEVELIRTFSKTLRKYIPSEYFNSLEKLALSVLSDVKQKDIRLIHGDLYRENVLLTYNMNNISGIIDWSDASIGDVALDLAAVSMDFELNDILPIFRRFEGFFTSNVFRRIGLYQTVEPLYSAYYFSKAGDTEKTLNICERINDNWHHDEEFRNIYNINDVKDLWHTKQK